MSPLSTFFNSLTSEQAFDWFVEQVKENGYRRAVFEGKINRPRSVHFARPPSTCLAHRLFYSSLPIFFDLYPNRDLVHRLLCNYVILLANKWRRGSLMVSTLVSGWSGPGWILAGDRFFCSWADILLSQCHSPPTTVQMGAGNLMLGVTLR